jgi:hypothetical protein
VSFVAKPTESKPFNATPAQKSPSRLERNQATTLSATEIGDSKSENPQVGKNPAQMKTAAMNAAHAQPRPRFGFT